MPGDFESRADRAEAGAICHHDVHAAAFFVLELARIRREPHGHEADSCKVGGVQGVRQSHAVQPRGAEVLERRIRTAADREVRRLKQSDAGVKDSLCETPHIGRGVDPGESGRVEKVAAPPAFHLHDLQVEAEFKFLIEHAGEFPRRHRMSDGNRVKAHERFTAGVEDRAGDVDAVDRVGPVEHDEPQLVFCGGLHRVAHRRDVRVITCANVLNIEHERIDS